MTEYYKDFYNLLINNKDNEIIELEKQTKYKLFNKKELLNNLDKIEDLLQLNLLIMVDYNDLLKNNFSFIFTKDNLVIKHNNIIINKKDVDSLDFKDSNVEYCNIIKLVIKYFLDYNPDIECFCMNINSNILKLYLSYSQKYFKGSLTNNEFRKSIINGSYFKKTEEKIEEKIVDNKSNDDEIDNYVFNEIMSTLNTDIDIDYLLSSCEKINNLKRLNDFTGTLSIQNIKNITILFFIIYKLTKILLKIEYSESIKKESYTHYELKKLLSDNKLKDYDERHGKYMYEISKEIFEKAVEKNNNGPRYNLMVIDIIRENYKKLTKLLTLNDKTD